MEKDLRNLDKNYLIDMIEVMSSLLKSMKNYDYFRFIYYENNFYKEGEILSYENLFLIKEFVNWRGLLENNYQAADPLPEKLILDNLDFFKQYATEEANNEIYYFLMRKNLTENFCNKIINDEYFLKKLDKDCWDYISENINRPSLDFLLKYKDKINLVLVELNENIDFRIKKKFVNAIKLSEVKMNYCPKCAGGLIAETKNCFEDGKHFVIGTGSYKCNACQTTFTITILDED